MRLFEMTDAQLDAEVQRHYDHMYNEYYGVNEPERECSNCRFYECPVCSKLEDACTQEELDEMEEADDYSAIEKAADDYCDDHDFKEPDYPDWMDGDY